MLRAFLPFRTSCLITAEAVAMTSDRTRQFLPMSRVQLHRGAGLPTFLKWQWSVQ
jgi:hypothetical protein